MKKIIVGRLFFLLIAVGMTMMLGAFSGEISLRVIVAGATLNFICLVFSYILGKFGGSVSFIVLMLGAYANLTIYIQEKNYFFFALALFTVSNGMVSIVLAIFSEGRMKREDQLIQMNQIDGLTDVYNHRHFQNSIDNIFEQCKTSSKNLNLLMLDVDNFKLINDYFGHGIGDELLVNIAKIIKATIREEDRVYRYGGDEFIILLPDITLEDSKMVSERLLHNINSYQNKTIQEAVKKFEITASIGISSFPEFCDNHKKLIHQADMALYDSKYSGRNRYTIHANIADTSLFSLKEYNNYVKSLLILIDSTDHYTYGHSIRISQYINDFGKYLGFSKVEINELKIAALLHDIGKIEIPDKILNKKEPLTVEESKIISEHPAKSIGIIDSFVSDKNILDAVAYHHESYNGKGYPKGLAGDEIPLHARILSIVDAYDAMRTRRIYSEEMSMDQALREIMKCSNIQFDPKLANDFSVMMLSNSKSFFENYNYMNNDIFEEHNTEQLHNDKAYI